jgi:hypothetical protein
MSTATLSFHVRDLSGQKSATVDDCSAVASVSEVIPTLLDAMQIPRLDVSGNPLTHTLRRDSDGVILSGSDAIGSVLEPGESVVVQPSIEAGAGRRRGVGNGG